MLVSMLVLRIYAHLTVGMQAQKELRQRAEEANIQLEGQRQRLQSDYNSLKNEAEVSRLLGCNYCDCWQAYPP